MGQWDFGGRKEKKTQKGEAQRKYAQLTTDLRNAVANKNFCWAECGLRTLITEPVLTDWKGIHVHTLCARLIIFKPLIV